MNFLRTRKYNFSNFPEIVTIEPINACNLRCPMCPTGNGTLSLPKKSMSLSNYKKLIDQCEGKTKLVILYNFGEPFLHKDILEMVSYTQKKNIDVRLSTNGHFIKTLSYAKEIINSGLSSLIFSVDGLSQETYEKYRVGGKLDVVLKAVKLLVKAKKELKADNPRIVFQFLLMKHNEHERKNALKLAKKLGVNSYYEKAISFSYGDGEFESIANTFIPKNKKINLYKNNNFNGLIMNNCDHIKKTMMINSDGSVIPCCHDEESAFILGNVFEQSIKKVWNGKSLRKFRKKVFNNQASISICQKCPFSRKVESQNLIEHFNR
jgi:radical SAM protein with 4Fe4S-binding SPASM domain